MKTWQRVTVRVVAVVAFLLTFAVFSALLVVYTETGTRWALRSAAPLLRTRAGVELAWDSLDGTLLGGLQLQNFTLSSATATGSLQLTVEQLQFAWQPWQLLDDVLKLDSVQISGLSFASDSVDDPAAEPLTSTGLSQLLFTLPLAIELQNFDSKTVQLRFNETRFDFDVLTGSAILAADQLQLTDIVWQQGITRVSGTATLTPALALQGQLNWQTQLSEQNYAGNVDVGGNLQQLTVTHQLQQPLVVLSTGSIVPGLFAGETFAVDLRHQYTLNDLAVFGQPGVSLQQGDIVTRGGLEALAINGSTMAAVEGFDILNLAFSLDYSPESIGINSIQMDSTQISLGGSGTLQLEPLQLQLDWQLARLDPGERLPQLQLDGINGEGSILLTRTDERLDASIELGRLEGLLNNYPLAVAGKLEVVDSQLATVDLQASNRDNTLAVTGTATPALDLQWQLQAPALQQLWQGLGGQLSGQGTLSGSIAAPEVNGQLQGQQLQFASGATTVLLQSLQLQANFNNAVNDIRLNVEDLTMQDVTDGQRATRELLQQGVLTITGTPERHQVVAQLTAPEATVALRVQGSQSDTNWQGTLLSASADSIYGNWELEDATALSVGNGSFALAENCWNAAPVRVCLSAAQSAPAGINAALHLTDFPLQWLNPAVGVAANAAGSNANIGPAKPQGLQNLQDTFALNLPANLRAEGRVDLDATLTNLQGAQWDSLDMDIVTTNAVLQITQDPDPALQSLEPVVQRFSFHDNTASVHNTAGVWSAELAFQVSREADGGAALQGGFRGNVGMQVNGDLDGELAFDFNDLAWLETVVPDMQNPQGMLVGSAVVSGNRSRPLLQGQLRLQDGSFELPVYGLAISDIGVTLQSLANNEISLQASATSGAGTLNLTSHLLTPLLDSRIIEAELSGTNFTAFNADASSVSVSPQLKAHYADNALTVQGMIEVPEAAINLTTFLGDISSNAVQVSRDVVIVQTDVADINASRQSTPLEVTANIALRLGDKVNLRGFGLDASLNGELTLEQSPGRLLLVYGELGIPAGSYEIYNQQLNTRNGRIIFFGNPLNPVVDIRAFRETSNAEVGMLLSGSINDIHGDLYSTPTMADNEILALLITGKSFNNVNDEDGDALLSAIANFGFERGQGLTSAVSSKLGLDSVSVGGGSSFRESSLGLGKYITPDLLMRYKVGLFDRQSVLSIDYKLSERLKLEVESGISQSVDITYTIEKD